MRPSRNGAPLGEIQAALGSLEFSEHQHFGVILTEILFSGSGSTCDAAVSDPPAGKITGKLNCGPVHAGQGAESIREV